MADNIEQGVLEIEQQIEDSDDEEMEPDCEEWLLKNIPKYVLSFKSQGFTSLESLRGISELSESQRTSLFASLGIRKMGHQTAVLAKLKTLHAPVPCQLPSPGTSTSSSKKTYLQKCKII